MTAITWTGRAGDSNYENPANWSPAQVPTASDTVTISESAVTPINAGGGAALSLTDSKSVTLNVANNTSFTFGSGSAASTFTNAGTLALNSGNQATDLIVGGAKLTLTGAGKIILSDNGSNAITGGAGTDQLINTNNLIEGAGQIGAGTLTLTNSAAGTILATGGNALFINTGAATVTNAGLLEASGTGGLLLQSVIANTGHITAAGGNVYLQGAAIQGGTLSSSGGAAITVQSNQTGTLDGTAHALTNTGTVAVNNSGTLSLLGSIVNSGQIALQSGNQSTDLIIGAAAGKATTVTLTGTGTVTLSDNSSNRIYGGVAGDTLVNATNTIAGAGQIGVGTLTLVNHATIDATGSNYLVVDTTSLVNTALLEATSGGGLVLQSAVNDSNGGTLLANGANIYLQGADITGGLLNSMSTSSITVQSNQTGTLDGSATPVTNAGTLAINNSGTLSVLGSLVNTGAIQLQSGNQSTDFVISSPTLTLSGGGTIALSDNSSNRIYGAVAADVLDNVNNTIVGAGQIGVSQLTLVNAGTILSQGGNALYLNGDSSVTNTGLLEAGTGGGGLILQSTNVANAGGTITALASNVYLQNSTITGGLLTTAAAQAFEIQSSYASTLDGSAATVNSTGTIQVDNQGTLSALGTLNNTGTILLNSANQLTELIVASPTLTLTGGGSVTLSNNSGNAIFGAGAADVLNNFNNTISGAGALGDGQLTIVNAQSGTIDANQSNTLVLSTGGSTVSNAGLLEATSSGGLQILSTTVATSSTGTVLANGGNINLSSGTLAGGLLVTEAGGQFVVAYNNVGTLDGSAATVTLDGSLTVQNQGSLTVLGTLTNNGLLNLASANQNTDLIFGSASGNPGTVTLNGTGSVLLSDNNGNRIYGGQAANTLVLDQAISGAGQLGVGQLTLVNNSTIDATGTNGLYVSTTGPVINNAVLEATNPSGGLVLQSNVDNTGGGSILAAGGNVYLQGASLIGGTLNSSLGAVINVQGNNTGELNGSTQAVTNLGTVTLSNQATLNLAGTINNKGLIALQSGNQLTDLVVDSSRVTLTGGGNITLSDNSGNRIYGIAGTDVLDNLNNTISGAGSLGAGQLTLINAGTINATGTNALILSTGHTITNTKLIEATGSGGLVLQDRLNDSGAGTILAAGGNIYLQGGVIAGGTIGSSGGAVVNVQSNNTGGLDGTTQAVTNTGTVTISNQGTLDVSGSIANKGLIALQSGNQNTDLIVSTSTVTLTGGGTITLDDNAGNRIYGALASDLLYNVGDTIVGAGQLGAGQLNITNSGTIEALGSNALVTNVGKFTNTATGQLIGAGSGGLTLQAGTYSNAGTIIADNGSNVTLQSGAVFTNDNTAGLLSGGTYIANASGNGATVSIAGVAVKTDAANIILEGAGSAILFGGTTIETSLKTIASNGRLQVLAGRAYTTTNALTLAGQLNLQASVFTSHAITEAATGTISGTGTLVARLADAGTILAVGGTLNLKGGDTVSGNLGGTGTITFGGGASALNAGTTLTASAIALVNKATLAINTNVSFAGTFDLGANSTLSGAGTLSSSGNFMNTGSGQATVSDPFANSGTITASAGGTLAFTGGLANTGLILANGTFTDTAALSGGTLSVGTGNAAAIIASAAGAGPSTLSTLNVAGGTLNTSGTTLTVTNDYNNTAAGTGNAYTPFAGVSGTIDGQGTQLAVMGVKGTTITSVNGTETISISPGGHAYFVIENTGPTSAAALRGALETSVNGGNITSSGLSGAGVHAVNYGPIAGGASSNIFTINYSSGPLTNQAIHFASDFANVPGLTIDIVAAPQAPAMSTTYEDAAHPVLMLDWHH